MQSIVKHTTPIGDAAGASQDGGSPSRWMLSAGCCQLDAVSWMLSLGNAEIGEVLRDRREHAVELARLRDLVIHLRLAGAALEQAGVSVDHPDCINLDVVGLGIGARLAGA